VLIQLTVIVTETDMSKTEKYIAVYYELKLTQNFALKPLQMRPRKLQKFLMPTFLPQSIWYI